MHTPSPFFIAAFLLFIVWSGCNQPTSTSKQTDNLTAKKTITIDTFSVRELSGESMKDCFCNFSIDSLPHQQGATIFVYDLATIAFMKINGEIVLFKQTDYSTGGTAFESKNYELMLETIVAKEISKGITWQSGTIRIADKNGNNIVTKYYGECGCSN